MTLVEEARREYLLWGKRAQRHRCPCWLVACGWECVFIPFAAQHIDAASIALDLAVAAESEERGRDARAR